MKKLYPIHLLLIVLLVATPCAHATSSAVWALGGTVVGTILGTISGYSAYLAKKRTYMLEPQKNSTEPKLTTYLLWGAATGATCGLVGGTTLKLIGSKPTEEAESMGGPEENKPETQEPRMKPKPIEEEVTPDNVEKHARNARKDMNAMIREARRKAQAKRDAEKKNK